MEDNIIYMRTPVGTQVARDPAASLPRAMRTLLLSVDGRTRVSSYRMILSHLGDVALLFEGLENAGYIARTDGVQTRVAPPPPPAPRPANIAAQLQSLAAATGFHPSQEPSVMGSPPTKNFEVLAKINEVQAQFTQNPPSLSGRTSAFNPTLRAANLNRAKGMMTDFLMQHLPAVAMEVSLSIDRIDTAEELSRALDDYAQLVAKLGRVSVEHLRDVRALIQQ
jgi:hypothetical protein